MTVAVEERPFGRVDLRFGLSVSAGAPVRGSLDWASGLGLSKVKQLGQSISVFLRCPPQAGLEGDGPEIPGRSSFEARHSALKTRVNALMTRASG